jgi:hypothetical protein
MNILTSFKGLRTYIVCAIALVLLLADYNGWFKVPPQIIAACGLVALAFLRAGIKSDTGASEDSAAPSASSGGKALGLFLCLAAFTGLLFCVATGCKTGPPGSAPITVNTNGLVSIGNYTVNTNDVYTSLRTAAKLGTQAALRYDANSREYFEAVEVIFTTALNDQNFDPNKIEDALSNISLKEARDPNVISGVESALAIYQMFLGNVWAQKIENANVYLAPALAAIRDGIAAGLPPAPSPAIDIQATVTSAP